MIGQTTAVLWAILAVGATTEKIALPDSQVAIARCTAVATMLASTYATYPDDVQLRTDLINREKEKLVAQLGITDIHLMSAYVAMAFYDGRRIAGGIPKSAPIDAVHIAAEGAANCMATTFIHGAA